MAAVAAVRRGVEPALSVGLGARELVLMPVLVALRGALISVLRVLGIHAQLRLAVAGRLAKGILVVADRLAQGIAFGVDDRDNASLADDRNEEEQAAGRHLPQPCGLLTVFTFKNI